MISVETTPITNIKHIAFTLAINIKIIEEYKLPSLFVLFNTTYKNIKNMPSEYDLEKILYSYTKKYPKIIKIL